MNYRFHPDHYPILQKLTPKYLRVSREKKKKKNPMLKRMSTVSALTRKQSRATNSPQIEKRSASGSPSIQRRQSMMRRSSLHTNSFIMGRKFTTDPTLMDGNPLVAQVDPHRPTDLQLRNLVVKASIDHLLSPAPPTAVDHTHPDYLLRKSRLPSYVARPMSRSVEESEEDFEAMSDEDKEKDENDIEMQEIKPKPALKKRSSSPALA